MEQDLPEAHSSAGQNPQTTLAGLGALAASLGLAEATAALRQQWRSPLLAVGDAFIDRTPRWLKDLAIDWFGTNDKLALLIGMWATMVVLSIGVGVLWRHRGWRTAAAVLLVFGLVGLGAAVTTANPAQSSVIPSLAALGGAALAVIWIERRETAAIDESATNPVIGVGADRRTATRAIALLGVGTVTGIVGRALGGRRSLDGERAGLVLPSASSSNAARAEGNSAQDGVGATVGSSPGDAPTAEAAPAGTVAGAAAEKDAGAEPEPADEPSPDNGLEPPETLQARLPEIVGLTPLFTPNDDFYRIDTALTVPQVSVDDWTLTISGMVGSPITLTWNELLELPFVEADITLSCVSNEIGGSLLGTARWLGTRLDDLLDRAQVDPAADQIVGRSVDGYTCGFPVSALDGRNALVAIGMNGEPLPAQHGYPARLIVPGLYGYVSATKWLTGIELTRFDEFDQYWVERDWVDDAPIKTQSRIDTPRPLASLSLEPTVIAGVAWAQTRGVAQVEVQIDDGDWTVANLAPAVNRDTWVQWWLDWTPEPGRHTITVRATDATGRTQVAERTTPFPSGATGRHEIVVTARA